MAGWGALLAAGVTLLLGTMVLALSAARRALPPVSENTVGFFHPNADDGGGGERVLWTAIKALKSSRPDLQVWLYCRPALPEAELLAKVLRDFQIAIPGSLRLVPLPDAGVLAPSRYAWAALARQSFGSARLAWSGLKQGTPALFIDSAGWSASLPLARLAGCRTACYVHYPAVRTDLRPPQSGGGVGVLARSAMAALKGCYYRVLALVYGAMGACSGATMVNSSWTLGHIRRLWWWQAAPIALVYPPCPIGALASLPLDRPLKRLYLVSVGQFRPEKDHALLLRSYARARADAARLSPSPREVTTSQLRIIGSCRHAGDQERLEGLRGLARELGIEQHVQFLADPPFEALRLQLAGAVGGLHCMRDEHFGISLVEYIAAGVIPIAHRSGGPAADIVVEQRVGASDAGGCDGARGWQITGFLAETEQEYADAMCKVLTMEQRQRLVMTASARQRTALFSEERFSGAFLDSIRHVLPPGTAKEQ